MLEASQLHCFGVNETCIRGAVLWKRSNINLCQTGGCGQDRKFLLRGCCFLYSFWWDKKWELSAIHGHCLLSQRVGTWPRTGCSAHCLPMAVVMGPRSIWNGSCCPIKGGEHQSTLRDALKFWDRDIPFLRVLVVAILPPLGGTCLKGWEQRAKQDMEV